MLKDSKNLCFNLLKLSYSKNEPILNENNNFIKKIFDDNKKFKLLKKDFPEFKMSNFKEETALIYYHVYFALINKDKTNLIKYLSYPLFNNYRNIKLNNQIFMNKFNSINIVNENNFQFYQIFMDFYYSRNKKQTVCFERKKELYNDLSWKIRNISN